MILMKLKKIFFCFQIRIVFNENYLKKNYKVKKKNVACKKKKFSSFFIYTIPFSSSIQSISFSFLISLLYLFFCEKYYSLNPKKANLDLPSIFLTCLQTLK